MLLTGSHGHTYNRNDLKCRESNRGTLPNHASRGTKAAPYSWCSQCTQTTGASHWSKTPRAPWSLVNELRAHLRSERRGAKCRCKPHRLGRGRLARPPRPQRLQRQRPMLPRASPNKAAWQRARCCPLNNVQGCAMMRCQLSANKKKHMYNNGNNIDPPRCLHVATYALAWMCCQPHTPSKSRWYRRRRVRGHQPEATEARRAQSE